MSEHPQELSEPAIWTWPIVLGLLTTVGLVGALFSDGGWGDLLAGLCLWAPAVAGLWHGWLRRRAD
jgi:hypothetical protein